jgi:hypothetical protein
MMRPLHKGQTKSVKQGIDDEDDAMLEDLHEEEDAMLEDLHVIEDNEDNEVDAVSKQVDKASAKKDTGLDGSYWNPGGHAGHCLSVIKGYGNLEATLSTP